jgi:methylated-DNA-protein-cysteine methyltransferase-like protein
LPNRPGGGPVPGGGSWVPGAPFGYSATPMGDPDTLFTRRVLTVVRRIPSGRVSTYGDVAAMAGKPTAWRAVGNIMRDCRVSGVPCHRVVASGGKLGGYSGLYVKRGLLRAEGVTVVGQQLRGFNDLRWRTSGR